jgi:hypothetical protein
MLLVLVAWYLHRQWELLKVKVTTTNIGALGNLCLSERPEIADRDWLLDAARRVGARGEKLLTDGWGEEIEVLVSRDEVGIHCTVFSGGPGVQRPAGGELEGLPHHIMGARFIWRDGDWIRYYDPRLGEDQYRMPK